MPATRLPFGSEFSPNQIDLAVLLRLAERHGGDRAALERAILEQYFSSRPISEENRAKLAMNAWLSMKEYGVLDESSRLSDLGHRLLELAADPGKMYEEFARHILLNLGGGALIQCILDMQAAGEKVTLVQLRSWLRDRGLDLPPGTKYLSTMRLWLAKAGVFTTGWAVDEQRFEELLGAPLDLVDRLGELSREQEAFLRALSILSLDAEGLIKASDVRRHAERLYGLSYNEKSLPKDVLYPLRDIGLIVTKKATAGRGAKSTLVALTETGCAKFLEPVLQQMGSVARPGIRRHLRRPLRDIVGDLKAENRHARGLALEALALRLMWLLDLSYVCTRVRGAQTGGAEVDLLFESARLVFSRWQVQCKNTARVSLDDIAREVGLTHMLKSNVIVIVSTGNVSADARKYADTVMRDSNLCVVLLDRHDLNRICESSGAIVEVFDRQAKHAMRVKDLGFRREGVEP